MPVPHINTTPLHLSEKNINGYLKGKDKDALYCIENYDLMDPFLMSIVSSCDLWMYLSSYGGLTAGRQNYNNALFPYETDDRLHTAHSLTGPATVIRVRREQRLMIWEPFSDRYKGMYEIRRNIYKNISGSKVIFEEINNSLQLSFSYSWSGSDELGWVRKASLKNMTAASVELDVTDGLQNLIPWGITRETQSMMSTLMDAYKVAEKRGSIALFRMSSIPVDRAEPSEALRTNVAWSSGLEVKHMLLSTLQLKKLREGKSIEGEELVFGQKTGFFIHSSLTLTPQQAKSWYIVADVARDSAQVLELEKLLVREKGHLDVYIETCIAAGEEKLRDLVAMSDGIQDTGDILNDRRHFANVMFNIMRGGIFEKDYRIEVDDFLRHLKACNVEVYHHCRKAFDNINPVVNMQELISLAHSLNDNDLLRITLEYLPLSFSRRHGDPSRPWNFFDINVKNTDGTPSLNYQGNWRDIFQNWETLGFSFPAFLPGMIARFLNASTADGYNPYRILRDGFDWEVPEPDNPWAFIGYWGDHQIIYLLRLLEMQEKFFPGSLSASSGDPLYVYANVPYRIKKYDEIISNPQDTIVFKTDLHEQIINRSKDLGSDGKLLVNGQGKIHKASFHEKLMLTLLTKLSNLVPEAGIWLNTQRPEWNDANNALVGNGTSMVTLYQMRRFITFLEKITKDISEEEFLVSDEVKVFFNDIFRILTDNRELLHTGFSNRDRRKFVDLNGKAAEQYREKIYNGFSGSRSSMGKTDALNFFSLALQYLDQSIAASRRTDGLYQSYNLIEITDEAISIDHLYLMLEGQVNILGSGLLDASQTLNLLDTLFASDLWREDQQSFMLYPFRKLPSFMEKNIIPHQKVSESPLLQKLLETGDTTVIKKDGDGDYHFAAELKNARLLEDALAKTVSRSQYSAVADDMPNILAIYESVFNHRAFTGRSGSFYKYEGLGSIYWHMVSKLLLATGESICCFERDDNVVSSLKDYYYRIKEGIGLNKHPQVYGAFTTDPYSHTPSMMGAQQPGMTGQVKEDILSRFNELGLMVKDGEIHFNPLLLRDNDLTDDGELCFSFCNTSIMYTHQGEKGIKIYWQAAPPMKIDSLVIPAEVSQEIFNRTERIVNVVVCL